jgi:hypothetical protein
MRLQGSMRKSMIFDIVDRARTIVLKKFNIFMVTSPRAFIKTFNIIANKTSY